MTQEKLNKKLLLISTTIYTVLSWSVLQYYIINLKVHALSSSPITHPHMFFIRLPCFLHVPWRYILNLRCTCAHHMYIMRNPCPLTSSPNPNFIFRLFPILLDPEFFQTVLATVTWLPGHMPISYPFVRYRLIIIILIYVWLTLILAKVCPHSCTITICVLSIALYKFPL